MKLGRVSGIFVYIIGALIVLPLILLLFNYVLINKNDASKYISKYMTNITEIKIIGPKFDPDPYNNPIKFKLVDTKLATKNMGRDATKRSTMRYLVVYSRDIKRYIQITMFDLRGGFWNSVYDSRLLVKVNKDDYMNSLLGTLEKPLLAFSVRGENRPLLDSTYLENREEKYYNLDTSPEQYKYNVSMYLTYVMPKSEFKKRFEGITLWYTPLLEIKGVKESVPFIMIIVPLIFFIYFAVRLYKANHPR